MDRSADLLEKARQCRRLARHSTDARTISVLLDTAEAYEREAKAAQAATPTVPHLPMAL